MDTHTVCRITWLLSWPWLHPPGSSSGPLHVGFLCRWAGSFVSCYDKYSDYLKEKRFVLTQSSSFLASLPWTECHGNKWVVEEAAYLTAARNQREAIGCGQDTLKGNPSHPPTTARLHLLQLYYQRIDDPKFTFLNRCNNSLGHRSRGLIVSRNALQTRPVVSVIEEVCFTIVVWMRNVHIFKHLIPSW